MREATDLAVLARGLVEIQVGEACASIEPGVILNVLSSCLTDQMRSLAGESPMPMLIEGSRK